MLRHALVVAVLAVFTLASAAWGESSWILWFEYVNPLNGATVAKPLRALESREQCERASTLMKERMPITQSGPGVRGTDIVYSCFPDTIDPRGPKGSGR